MADNSPLTQADEIKLANFAPRTFFGAILRIFAPLLDWLLGIRKLRYAYINNNLSGLNKADFAQKLLTSLGVTIVGEQSIANKIPKTGRLIVICNHPYGMIEGVIIARLLASIRPDTKILANVGLRIFKEINDYFIFANPLRPKDPINAKALKQCFNHLNNDGLLVVFPAGRVSFYQKEKGYITDGQWNRIGLSLAKKTSSDILPVFISGTNSPIFHRLGRIYYRFRLLMLAREMFKLEGKTIELLAGNIIANSKLNQMKTVEHANDFIRANCYINDPNYKRKWVEDAEKGPDKAILPALESSLLLNEIEAIPQEQHLVDYKNFSVYCGYQQQLPHCVTEIARLREITFRTLNEGSGEPIDTDHFDATYLHLFIFDHQANEIIGAYRIGLSDKLQQAQGKKGLYLSQMFTFGDEFINQKAPCMEMGRSFIVEKHQASFYGLLLLWKGIGAFASRNPQYRTLYGTVSLSKLYDPSSVALINQVMVSTTESVSAKTPFIDTLHPEVLAHLSNHDVGIAELSSMVMALESDGKDIPILLKQYHKLGAKFHCIGIDSNFNHTPGMLLSVHLPSAPDKLLKLYLGDGKDEYLAYQPPVA